MKLYRGLKSEEFREFSNELAAESDALWTAIISRRARGQLSFPVELSSAIRRLERVNRLRKQHFTDHRAIALKYAKLNGGALVEIDVPVSQIVRCFFLEFQNFAKRKKSFEVVYLVDAKVLLQNAAKWRMKVTRPSRPTRLPRPGK